MKETKRKAVWLAATPTVMGTLQTYLYFGYEEPMDLPACCVQEDPFRDSNALDEEAFLQAYIEGSAMCINGLINIGKDPCYHLPCDAINWPTLWMTKLLIDVRDWQPEEDTDDILEESDIGTHELRVLPKDMADNTIKQVLAPVTVGALQAGLAYLKLSTPKEIEDIHREIFMTEDEAYRTLESFRDTQRHMLRELLTPKYSVISHNAIHR